MIKKKKEVRRWMEEKMAHQGIQRNSIETEKKNPLWTFEMLYNENTLF